MKTSRGMFGIICLVISIVVIYGLFGYKAYVFFSEGIWLDWSAGNYLPDPMILAVIRMRPSPLKTMVIWLLSQDVLVLLLPFPLIVAWIDGKLGRDRQDA
ncbi:hypothetical protein [Desulfolutivibrio sulfoxidireducens]|uniref:hypothetical protein n=1 Tax=Desulfolutivibrio sulfoxidireducens TaxID=2773299 RepID=UPI00159DD3AF|nr:hypothetical protein [Desulfolutivibrio sulfoxidireducens]QLA16491.1 hypothetical protein GD605_10350 [Desulfolutivibrio sulfoxidireducens]QLA19631.1 hypothetical protein GD604_07720 [Desulfolutivibrio sulfoxidireducens]